MSPLIGLIASIAPVSTSMALISLPLLRHVDTPVNAGAQAIGAEHAAGLGKPLQELHPEARLTGLVDLKRAFCVDILTVSLMLELHTAM